MRFIPWFMFVLFASVTVRAAVTLPNVFGDHMVLQRDAKLPVWGWDAPGQTVAVTFAGVTHRATANAAGAWRVDLPAMPADGKTYQMVVKGSTDITFSNVVIGEVWLCSGQSNMEMGLKLTDNGPAELAAANHPDIRLLSIPKSSAGLPQQNVNAKWAVCTPASMNVGDYGGFSAVGYYFGRKLRDELKVPVGLINASWGGSSIELWTPVEGYKTVPRFRFVAAEVEKTQAALRQSSPGAAAVGKAPGQPTAIYNAMIAPLAPFAIRGMLWYQGEANLAFMADGANYAIKQRALIQGWRQMWGQGDFPVYFAQLAPLESDMANYRNLPAFWEAQTAAQAVPNTGMVITYDTVKDLKDIHPTNKREVGLRMAAMALHETFGRRDIICRGPAYKSLRIDGDKAIVTFDHADGGLVTADKNAPNEFLIAGGDGKFVPAAATISGPAEVTVSSSEVKQPTAVRFAWTCVSRPNLRNGAGLPANSFRTDSPIVKSLAYQKSVRSPDEAQVDHVPENVTDGITDNSSGWHVMGPNKAIEVDLETVQTIDRVVVYPYYDGVRKYAYTAEISADGKAWTQVADMTNPAGPETAAGHEHRFTATPARFVRVTLLSNTANAGLHLNEILVFGPAAN